MTTRPLRALAVVAALALVAMPAAPALAKPVDMDTADRIMLSDAQAVSVGMPKTATRFFGKWSTPGDSLGEITLCSLAVVLERVDAPPRGYSTYFFGALGSFEYLRQSVYLYPSSRAASQAFAQLMKKASKCAGDFSYLGALDDTVNVTTTNGVSIYRDEEWAWVRGDAAGTKEIDPFVASNFSTYRLVGNGIATLEMTQSGDGASPLTAAQISKLRKLTISLGNAWKRASGG